MKLSKDDFWWSQKFNAIICDVIEKEEEAQPVIEQILKNQKIVEELKYRKKYPQAFNYAQFEVWITDILNGGNGFHRIILENKE